MLAAARVFLVKATGVSAIVHPPKARIFPTTLETHGHVRVDSYHWLRERDKPEVVDYLRTENDYTAAVMRHTECLQTALFEEIKGRIKQTDMSVPYREGDYYYYTRFEAGKEYPIYCRKRGSPILDGLEQVILDVNVMATGYEFYAVESRVVSSAQDILAYAADTVGRRISTIQFKNLETGEVLPDVIPDVTSNIAWANDNRTLFYAKQDPTTLRPFQIYRHRLGTSVSDDQLVYEEADETFGVAVFKTKSKKYLMVASFQTLSTEYRFLEADDPTGTFTVFLPREREHEYHVDHRDNTFYVRTNLDAKNFRLMETLVGQTGTKHWREVVPHRNDVLLAGIEMFKDYLVLQERKDGLTQIRIRPWSGQGEHALEFAEPAYQAAVSANPEMDTQILRYGYTSMTTPNSIYDYDMASRTQVLLKQEEVLGGFDARNYQTERVHARAHDGTKIPIIDRVPDGSEEGWHEPAAAVRIRRLRLQPRCDLQLPAVEPDRPRVHLRHRARSGRAGARPLLVRRWEAAEKEEYLYGLHCLCRAPRARALHEPRSPLRDGWERGRVADRGGPEHASRPVRGRGGAGAVRRCRHHHAGRQRSADDQ